METGFPPQRSPSPRIVETIVPDPRTAAIGVGALAGPALLAACGSGSSAPAVTSGGDLSKILPAYQPRTLIKPDIPGTNGSDPTYPELPGQAGPLGRRNPGRGRQIHRDHSTVDGDSAR